MLCDYCWSSLLGGQSDLIRRFSALKPLQADLLVKQTTVVIPWRLDLSLRSPASQEIYGLLTKLTANGLTQLILLRLRPSTLQRSPLAQAVAHCLKR